MLVSASAMQYYAIHVLTRGEDDYRRRLAPNLEGRTLFVPKRALPVRRMGKIRKEMLPVFPGYVFVESEDLLADLDFYWLLRHTPGFIRFLRENTAPTPLNDRERLLLRHFMSFGECADTSKVMFDENDRIVVISGPLKGLEGQIVKVNRRKGRAKVALDICETGFLIDLGFEAVERATAKGGGEHEDQR
jgi:transcriptional antiterminator NusG